MSNAYIKKSATDEWSTPTHVFAALNEEFSFNLDAAACAENAKCPAYYTKEDDGLSQRWNGVVWCNPPYSALKKWIAKAATEAALGATVVMLIPSRTDTAAWHDYIEGKAEVRFIRGRLQFGESKCDAPFPSVVVVFRSPDASTPNVQSPNFYSRSMRNRYLTVREVRILEATRVRPQRSALAANLKSMAKWSKDRAKRNVSLEASNVSR
jgi:site-specific DNA-methyltransferase (adenine-specific)